MNLLISRLGRLHRASRERAAGRRAVTNRVGRINVSAVASKLEASKPSEHVPDLFKFYEEAAEKTKAHAWAQTTWVLALNAGIIGFSLNFFASHGNATGFVLIEGIAASVGVFLCLFLIYLLNELGRHISHYWTISNRLASASPALAGFLSASDLAAARAGRAAPFPAFCRRLQFLAALFAAAHVGWFGVVALVLSARS